MNGSTETGILSPFLTGLHDENVITIIGDTFDSKSILKLAKQAICIIKANTKLIIKPF